MAKTRLMRSVEAKFGEPLEQLIPRLWEKGDQGLTGVAAELGVSKTTLWTWLLRMGFRVDHRLVKEG